MNTEDNKTQAGNDRAPLNVRLNIIEFVRGRTLPSEYKQYVRENMLVVNKYIHPDLHAFIVASTPEDCVASPRAALFGFGTVNDDIVEARYIFNVYDKDAGGQ